MQDSLPRLLLDGRVPLGTFSLGPLIEASREKCSPFLIPWLLQVVLARPPYRFSFIQGSSADVIQLPDMTAERRCFSRCIVWELFVFPYTLSIANFFPVCTRLFFKFGEIFSETR